MAAPLPNPHPPLVMDDIIISESNSIKVIRFKMDSLLTWEPQIIDILGQAKQRAGQLYHCHSFLTKQGICTTNISWIHQNMVGFFIWELLKLIYVVLMTCSPKLNGYIYLFFNHSLIVKML